MTPKRSWKGWTLVDPEGRIIIDDFDEPYCWAAWKEAPSCAEEGIEVVRCELRLL